MQHGMNAEAVEVMRRAYDNEPLLAMIPFQLAHTLNRLGRCDEALALAADAEELGGQPKVAIESGCAWLRKDRDGLIEAGHRFVEVGMGFPFKAIEMSVEEFTEARLDADSPLRSVMAQRMRALWEENPDPEKNMHIYWIVATATDIGDLDLVFEILDTIADENGFRGYTIAWSPLFAAKEESSRLRAGRGCLPLLLIRRGPQPRPSCHRLATPSMPPIKPPHPGCRLHCGGRLLSSRLAGCSAIASLPIIAVRIG
jgi:hypothetical protein